MNNTSFHLSVFTPAGLLLEEEVRSVTLPSAVGEIGILPKHVKYIGLLANGKMTYLTSTEEKEVEITGGFCSFADEKLVVLADG